MQIGRNETSVGAIERLRRVLGGGLTVSADGTTLRATQQVFFFGVLALGSFCATFVADGPEDQPIGKLVARSALLLASALGFLSTTFVADRVKARWTYSRRWLGLSFSEIAGGFQELGFVRLLATSHLRESHATRTSHRIEVRAGARDLSVLTYWTRPTPSEECIHEAETLAAFLGVPLRRSRRGVLAPLEEGPGERVAMPPPLAPRRIPFRTVGRLLVYLPLPYVVAPALLAAPLVIASYFGDPLRIFAAEYENILAVLAPIVAGLTLGGVRFFQCAHRLEGDDRSRRLARTAIAALLGSMLAPVVLYDILVDPIDLDVGDWSARPWRAISVMRTFAIVDFLMTLFMVPVSIANAIHDRRA